MLCDMNINDELAQLLDQDGERKMTVKEELGASVKSYSADTEKETVTEVTSAFRRLRKTPMNGDEKM